MKIIYLNSALKCDSFDATIGIKIPFFRVSVTIEPGRSLLQLVTKNCLISEARVFTGDNVFSLANAKYFSISVNVILGFNIS